MRKICLYTYNIDEPRFSQTNNLMLERRFVEDQEQVFAFSTGVKDDTNRLRSYRVAISSNPGEVYYDIDAGSYRVWFDAPDYDKAVEIISNYILDRIDIEIRTHQSFIDRLNRDRDLASELFENIQNKEVD